MRNLVSLAFSLLNFAPLQLLFDNTFHLGTGVMFPEFMLYNLEMENDERVVDIKVRWARVNWMVLLPLLLLSLLTVARAVVDVVVVVIVGQKSTDAP